MYIPHRFHLISGRWQFDKNADNYDIYSLVNQTFNIRNRMLHLSLYDKWSLDGRDDRGSLVTIKEICDQLHRIAVKRYANSCNHFPFIHSTITPRETTCIRDVRVYIRNGEYRVPYNICAIDDDDDNYAYDYSPQIERNMILSEWPTTADKIASEYHTYSNDTTYSNILRLCTPPPPPPPESVMDE